MTYDVIIIGGSYAGISAGMQLARARRTVLVIDAGQRRNRFASASHGFLAQDGRPPARIAQEARLQLLDYPSVQWHEATASSVEKVAEEIRVATTHGELFSARRLILATGVIDELPKIPGIAERWGQQVFHCPYCHGYELNGGHIGVLASSSLAMHQALLLPDWGPTTLFLNRAFEPDTEQLSQLAYRKVSVEREAVLAISGETLSLKLATGRAVSLAGLFVQPRTHLASQLVVQLGVTVERGPTGDFIKVDQTRETNVSGVFACGDTAVAAGNVAIAVGDGARTGTAVHQSLLFR